MTVFALEGWVSLVVLLAMLGVKGFALVSALTFSGPAYEAASKGNKVGWSIGLGVGFVAQLIMLSWSPISLISLAFIIVAFVYLADVRPALAEVTRR
ncbi:DUF2516 family protein [Nocardioides sp. LHG3406-4]|uniref:DUF2516 family protein n=1 Tax=Nocardioides sp. LHG3406-4 TaxID=2804575 RepID=UPI003CF972FB